VIEAAGGVVTDWKGGPAHRGGRVLAAGDRRVHEAALDLPARVQNRPIIVNLIWVAELPARFTFTNISRYRSAYREIVQTGEFRPLPDAIKRIDPVTGEEILDAVVVYEDITHAGRVIFDWKLDWSVPLYRQQLLVLSLEINNVFNSRIQTGGIRTTYEMGRQFWAGVAYDF
jgi:hypothetical protein